MTNVKPGDIARFIYGVQPPEFEGHFCLVIEAYPQGKDDKLLELAMQQHGFSQPWWVELLSGVQVKGLYTNCRSGIYRPGEQVGALDRFLRPIRPPGDVQEVFEADEIASVEPRVV